MAFDPLVHNLSIVSINLSKLKFRKFALVLLFFAMVTKKRLTSSKKLW
jgi:hypothetical protein